MINDKTYNGWVNYETWLVNIHTDNSYVEVAQEAYKNAEAAKHFTKEENAALWVAEHIEECVREWVETESVTNPLVSDLINAALGEVYWYEIAKHYIEQVVFDQESEAA